MNRNSATWISATRVWIPTAAALFTVALIVSAVVLPELRLPHVLQALIYVAVVWNSLNLFVTHNMQRGLKLFWSLLQAGQIPLGPHPTVPMMVLLGGIGHLVLISACLAALFDRRLDDKKPWKMVAGGVSVLAYFALIIIVSAPR
jgi:hypothetical protein